MDSEGARAVCCLETEVIVLILENIGSPEDIKKLNNHELQILCEELRSFLVNSVAVTGGHLASNLGAVELTVAIHRAFDTSVDRLVFDVGHQAYPHKILTGRREQFSTLRQFGGLSGFPKPYESIHDAFIAGHASNSVSVALGMARARTLQKKDYHVLALIGDGALSGGLAYEGLNNAGQSGEPLIVILNDNGMSINPNVGALSTYLADLRSEPGYYRFKKWYRSLFGAQPGQKSLYRFNHKVKTFLKKTLWPASTLFEDMGFTYLGPVDGHDLEQLSSALEYAKALRRPVVVHANTVKGKGYSYAEQEPERFHGVAPFDVSTGRTQKKDAESFSSVFGKVLEECASEDERVCAITAAMESGTGLTDFARSYPKRFFDVGIAEGHAISMAAGMAQQGMVPVVAMYSTFLQRSYDMLIHDIALQQLHVVLAVDRADLVGADGETHHGCFDAIFLSEVPGFTVLAPANFSELHSMLRWAISECTGPVAVRYPRGGECRMTEDTSTAPLVRLREGEEITLLAYGTMIDQILDAADHLAVKGISAGVVKLNRIAPLQVEDLLPVLGDIGTLLIAEASFGTGCVGQRISSILSEAAAGPRRLILKNLGKDFVPAGSVQQLLHSRGLDGEGIAASVLEEMK